MDGGVISPPEIFVSPLRGPIFQREGNVSENQLPRLSQVSRRDQPSDLDLPGHLAPSLNYRRSGHPSQTLSFHVWPVRECSRPQQKNDFRKTTAWLTRVSGNTFQHNFDVISGATMLETFLSLLVMLTALLLYIGYATHQTDISLDPERRKVAEDARRSDWSQW